MKTFMDLDEHQKKQAIKRQLKDTVTLIMDGVLELENKKDQALVDSILESSKDVLSATKMIMDSALGKKLYKIAVIAAESAKYNEFGMQVSVNIIEEDFPLFI